MWTSWLRHVSLNEGVLVFITNALTIHVIWSPFNIDKVLCI